MQTLKAVESQNQAKKKKSMVGFGIGEGGGPSTKPNLLECEEVK